MKARVASKTLVLVGMMFFAVSFASNLSAADEPSFYEKKGTWQESMLASREALMKQADSAGKGESLPNWGTSDFTVMAWVKTKADGGTIVAKAPAEGKWAPQGKVLFLRGGAPAVDVGWVGAVGSGAKVNDGQWHHVALTGRNPLVFYVDGKEVKRGSLELGADPPENVFKIGYCTPNFPGPSGFDGLIDEVRMYNRRLSAEEIDKVRSSREQGGKGLVGYWPMDNSYKDRSGNGNDGVGHGVTGATEGKLELAMQFNGRSMLILPTSRKEVALNTIWARLAHDFSDAKSQKEMAREQQDKIWDKDWKPGDVAALAKRYVESCADEGQRANVAEVAKGAKSAADLWKVSAAYHEPPPLVWPEATPLDTDPNLVAWWKFDEEAGTKAADSSKKGHDGKLTGGLVAGGGGERGRFGRALKFGGDDESVEITGYKGILENNPRTVSFWFKTESSRGEIISWGMRAPGKMFTVGFIRGRLGVVPQGGYLYVNDPLHDGKWHHFVAVVEEAEEPNLYDNVKLYQDGGPATIHDIGLLDLWPIDTGEDQNVRIGQGFTGMIDDVRIYDRPLSIEEVKMLHDVKAKAEK